MQIYFVEYAGEDALTKLETLKEGLSSLPFVQSLKLLKNTQQAKLYLLVIETSEEAHIDVPDGAKMWTFVEAES